MPNQHLTIDERFELKYVPEPNSGCYIWTGALSGRKLGLYGTFRVNGKTIKAHRYSYEKDFGMIELWDDRCVRVEFNTGVVLSG